MIEKLSTLQWDMDVVREVSAARGLDYDKLGPRSYARMRTLGEYDEGDNFCAKYEAILKKRNQK